jgi:putative exosortase-associated protein (TIGR04073 family)
MRKLVTTVLVGLGMTMGLAAPALAIDDNEMPPGIEKFNRGLVNVVDGLPDELVSHTVGAATEYGEDTFGGFVASTIGGIMIGTFWGVARIGSGIVDLVTFPVPFNDNAPLVEPDHHI